MCSCCFTTRKSSNQASIGSSAGALAGGSRGRAALLAQNLNSLNSQNLSNLSPSESLNPVLNSLYQSGYIVKCCFRGEAYPKGAVGVGVGNAEF